MMEAHLVSLLCSAFLPLHTPRGAAAQVGLGARLRRKPGGASTADIPPPEQSRSQKPPVMEYV